MNKLDFDWSQFNLDNLIGYFDIDKTGYIKNFNEINTEIEDTNWGYVELTKIIKKSDISNYFILMGPEQSPVYIKNSDEFLTDIELKTTGRWKVFGKKFSNCNPDEIDEKNLLKIKKVNQCWILKMLKIKK